MSRIFFKRNAGALGSALEFLFLAAGSVALAAAVSCAAFRITYGPNWKDKLKAEFSSGGKSGK